VRIDGDRAFAEYLHQHDVGCLAPHAGQRLQRFAIVRHFAVVPIEQSLAQRNDVFGLVAPEADGLDVLGHASFAELQHFRRRVRDLKERAGGAVDAFVCGLRGEHDGDEQGVGVPVVQLRARIGAHVRQARVELFRLGFGQALGHVRRPSWLAKRSA